MNVGIVGLGKMGGAIAQNLLTHGYKVFVWNRTSRSADELTVAGATACDSPAQLMESVDAAIVMLWGDDVAREISLGEVIPAARKGQLVIECSTLSPEMYRTLEEAATERGVDFVACPVIGSVDAARWGTLTLLPGGKTRAFERARELLAAIGSTVTFTGSVTVSGQLKLANNSVLGVAAEALGELVRVLEHAGVDRALAIDTVLRAFERMRGKAAQLLDKDFTARFSLDALLKDLRLAQVARRSLGVSSPLMDSVLSEFELAAHDGAGDLDYIAVAARSG